MRTLVSLSAQKRQPGVFVGTFEDGEELILHEEVVSRHRLTAGARLEAGLWEALGLESDRLRCLSIARSALSRRPLTALELKRRLLKGSFPKEIIDEVIEGLRQSGALNDEVYAQLFADARTRRKAGPRAIEQGLRQRGVSRETAKRAANDATDEEELRQNARYLLEKWRRSAKQTEPRKRAQAAAAFLMRKGYEGEIVWEIVREVFDNVDS